MDCNTTLPLFLRPTRVQVLSLIHSRQMSYVISPLIMCILRCHCMQDQIKSRTLTASSILAVFLLLPVPWTMKSRIMTINFIWLYECIFLKRKLSINTNLAINRTVCILLGAYDCWYDKNGYVTRIIKRFQSWVLVKKISKKKSKGRELLHKMQVKTREDNQ